MSSALLQPRAGIIVVRVGQLVVAGNDSYQLVALGGVYGEEVRLLGNKPYRKSRAKPLGWRRTAPRRRTCRPCRQPDAKAA